MTLAVIAWMVLVVACLTGLALTNLPSGRQSAARRVVVSVWMAVIVAGWIATFYLAFGLPGGPGVAAWAWIRAQPLVMQIATWVFLLPWTVALWVAQAPWAIWLRVSLIVALALVTVALTAREFPRRRRRGASAAGQL